MRATPPMTAYRKVRVIARRLATDIVDFVVIFGLTVEIRGVRTRVPASLRKLCLCPCCTG